MARAAPPGALELWLHKATDPSNPEENWEGIQRFIDQVNADPSRTTAALTLLEHKIQSPQELEALRALTVLEMCVNNCGDAFHHEMGKFRFLNGLIKVLSPKHLGERSTDKVKSRIVEILFSWTVWFPQEMKIRDAYHMLKKQGIVKKDPKLLADKILPPPSPRPASSIFDGDDEKSKLLTQLLKSRNPEDLQAANRLIKGIIKEEQERAAKLSRRMNAVREAHSSAEALEKMLNACKTSAATGGPKPALESLQDIVAKCEKLKVVMFQVAKETVEDEEALAEVLQASDRLTQAILLFKEFGGICRSPATSSAEPTAATPAPADQANSMTLIDFSEPESAFQVPKLSQGNANPESRQGRLPSSSSIHSLDEELMSLGLPNSPPAAAAPFSSQAPPESPPCPVPSAASLAKLFIPLDSITLSSAIPPLSVYEENGLKAMLHFSQDLVPRQPTIRVLVLSLLSTSPHPIWDIVFQAAVPKSMALKLQPATGSQLPAFNPLQRPTVISQVLLLANPQKAPLRLRYKLTYTQKEQTFTKTGEVLDFPHTELWGGIL